MGPRGPKVIPLFGRLGPSGWIDTQPGEAARERQLPGAQGGLEDPEGPYGVLTGLVGERKREGVAEPGKPKLDHGAAGGRS